MQITIVEGALRKRECREKVSIDADFCVSTRPIHFPENETDAGWRNKRGNRIKERERKKKRKEKKKGKGRGKEYRGKKKRGKEERKKRRNRALEKLRQVKLPVT